MSTLVLREDDGHVARLTLNSPANYNALSVEMISHLYLALQHAASDKDIRAIIIAANGKAFCAGHDLRQMQAARQNADGGRAGYTALFQGCAQLMQLLPTLPQPVIAQVQGIATAAGCQLVASCDLAIAAQATRFGVNGVNIGLFCTTPMVALTRAIPRKAAFEMLTTGEFILADRARELGLINRIAAPDDLAQDTMAMAQTIAAKLPAAVQMGKQAFYTQSGCALPDAYGHTEQVMCANMLLDDTAEGIAAFLDKRAPSWA